jgi:hypothetical protein
MVEEMEWSRAYVLGEGETPEQVMDNATAWIQARFWERRDANPQSRGHIAYWWEKGLAMADIDWKELRETGRRMLEDGEAVRIRAEVVHLGRPDEYLRVILAV